MKVYYANYNGCEMLRLSKSKADFMVMFGRIHKVIIPSTDVFLVIK